MFDYQDVRLIAIHRIQTIEILNSKITVPVGFELDNFINEGALHFGTGKKIKFEANINSDLLIFLKESPLSEDMKVISGKEKHKLKASVIDSWQLYWWILSQGDQIEILKPVYLRKSIKQSLEKSLKLYDE